MPVVPELELLLPGLEPVPVDGWVVEPDAHISARSAAACRARAYTGGRVRGRSNAQVSTRGDAASPISRAAGGRRGATTAQTAAISTARQATMPPLLARREVM